MLAGNRSANFSSSAPTTSAADFTHKTTQHLTLKCSKSLLLWGIELQLLVGDLLVDGWVICRRRLGPEIVEPLLGFDPPNEERLLFNPEGHGTASEFPLDAEAIYRVELGVFGPFRVREVDQPPPPDLLREQQGWDRARRTVGHSGGSRQGAAERFRLLNPRPDVPPGRNFLALSPDEVTMFWTAALHFVVLEAEAVWTYERGCERFLHGLIAVRPNVHCLDDARVVVRLTASIRFGHAVQHFRSVYRIRLGLIRVNRAPRHERHEATGRQS
jgi:hypothetical protein